MAGRRAEETGRIIGIDLGEKRIGVAVSDTGRSTAFARTIIQRTGDEVRDQKLLVAAIAESEATKVVVGLPFSLDGSVGPAARRATEQIEWLQANLDIPVESFDERFTSTTATRLRQQALPQGHQQRDRRRSHAKLRRPVDDLAAELILQAYLDRNATS